jgi:hypothetical protein
MHGHAQTVGEVYRASAGSTVVAFLKWNSLTTDIEGLLDGQCQEVGEAPNFYKVGGSMEEISINLGVHWVFSSLLPVCWKQLFRGLCVMQNNIVQQQTNYTNDSLHGGCLQKK